MKDLLNKFKIPTVLGLAVIVVGLVSGVYLIFREQIFLSRAAPNITPLNVIFSNQTGDSVTVSWQTVSPAASFVTYGQNNPSEQISLDDRDSEQQTSTPTPRQIHYTTIKKLLPKTKYLLKIVSGKFSSEVYNFETSAPLAESGEFTPVIGSVQQAGMPVEDGVVYLSLSDAAVQSAPVKKGNFLIPVSQIAKADFSGTFTPKEEPLAKLTIRSPEGESSAQFILEPNLPPLAPIALGQNIDFTSQTKEPEVTEAELDSFDLNSDGIINAADNAIILDNFGKKPKDPRSDLNSDGKIDQIDLDLMAQKLKDLGSQ